MFEGSLPKSSNREAHAGEVPIVAAVVRVRKDERISRLDDREVSKGSSEAFKHDDLYPGDTV